MLEYTQSKCWQFTNLQIRVLAAAIAEVTAKVDELRQITLNTSSNLVAERDQMYIPRVIMIFMELLQVSSESLNLWIFKFLNLSNETKQFLNDNHSRPNNFSVLTLHLLYCVFSLKSPHIKI